MKNDKTSCGLNLKSIVMVEELLNYKGSINQPALLHR